jgi:hypothetical protein
MATAQAVNASGLAWDISSLAWLIILDFAIRFVKRWQSALWANHLPVRDVARCL